MYRSQKLALKYFAATFVLFALATLFGLISSIYYLDPDFMFGMLHFNISKILHVDTVILFLLLGFMGAIYWLLPNELERELEGIWLAEILFWVLCAAIVVVAAVFLVVQQGDSNELTLWLVNQGRKYVEAPRWAALGVVVVMGVFAYNVIATAVKRGRISGVTGVLIIDLVPLLALYLIAFPALTNMTEDLHWWWWLVHLWVEATWEVLIGCILAMSLMTLIGTKRTIVESWLYVEVALVLGTGILGLGHHYFWIGTPEYWLAIGGFFSALEPLPLLGMVIHAIYDAGAGHMKTNNRPAFFWLLAEAFGNFIGAGVLGFMMTLPQINLFAHGTQWTVSHGHLAFWGAYATGIIAVVYIAMQHVRGGVTFTGTRWIWPFCLLNVGMLGMTGASLVSGITQALQERAIGGSTYQAFVAAQEHSWFLQGMSARMAFGLVFAVGFVWLVYDVLTMGRERAARPTPQAAE